MTCGWMHREQKSLSNEISKLKNLGEIEASK